MDENEQIIHISRQLSVGALASLDLVSSTLSDFPNAMNFKVKTLKGAIWYDGGTSGEGPTIVGLMNETADAGEEALEANVDYKKESGTAGIGNRRVFPLGSISNTGTAGVLYSAHGGSSSDDATSQAVKGVQWARIGLPKWKFEAERGDTLNLFAYNTNSGSPLTTGITITFQGVGVIQWLN